MEAGDHKFEIFLSYKVSWEGGGGDKANNKKFPRELPKTFNL